MFCLMSLLLGACILPLHLLGVTPLEQGRCSRGQFLQRSMKQCSMLYLSRSLPAAARPVKDFAKRAESPETAGAMVVVTAALATAFEYPTRASCEPGLNPYQPNHKIMTPRTNREVLWPGMSTTCEEYRLGKKNMLDKDKPE